MGFVAVAKCADLVEGEGRLLKVGEKRIALFLVGGEHYAIDNDCPHAGGPLAAGYVARGAVVCPLHLWCFDLASGECTDVPGTSVETYRTRVRDGFIEIEVGEASPG